MIVKFAQTFHVPGFGRKRFRKGVCYDIPEELREHLPKTAQILADDFKEIPDRKEVDARIAADYNRAAAEATDREALERAGLMGYHDATLETPDEQELAKKRAQIARMAKARAAKKAKKEAEVSAS